MYLSYLFLPAYLSYILPLTCHRVATEVFLGLRPLFCDFVPFGTGISKASLWVQNHPPAERALPCPPVVRCLNESLRAVVLKLEWAAEPSGGAC